MSREYRALIDGKLIPSPPGETMEVINPANGKIAGLAPKCTPAEINKAVAAARKAAPAWAALTVAERGKVLHALGQAIAARGDELAKLETTQYGGPLWKTTSFDMPFIPDMLDFYAGTARAMSGKTLPVGPTCTSMTVREPLGVVGLITPWNFPLITVIAKLAPALIMGNTCVVKPPSCAPLTTLILGEITVDIGMPPGVVNIVTGPGGTVGEALVKHPDVDKIAFTGDSIVGKRIMSLASDTVKPLFMELGGKNAFIILADADMESTVEGAVWSAFYNSGQNCASVSRFLVHEDVYDEFAEKFVAAAKKVTYGDPMKMSNMMGPLAYKGHRDSVEKYIASAKKSGAKLLLGGERPDTPDTRDGYFVAPTIFGECNNQMEFMREEIFGPVVGLIRVKSAGEAVAVTNDTRYGLCASVWTRDLRTALVMSQQLKVGTVWVNQHLCIVFEVPWGGVKESGFGKENSTLCLEEYSVIKHIWIDLVGNPATPWHDKV
ncbi:MAG: aldehyde dehydrogenase family protein [Dehalococcoidales bacterium]|jgi:acyl-CoA reductase-like NAD-dependent aldehyde dehydrogenase